MIEFLLPDSRHTYMYDASDLAKFLMIRDTQSQKILGRNKLLQCLRFNGVLCKDSNQPNMTMINLGLMHWHTTIKRHKTYGMPLFTDKGVNFIKARFADGRYQIGYEKRREKHTVKLEEIC